jgi:tetratricopeptide (TPR) repeat protein
VKRFFHLSLSLALLFGSTKAPGAEDSSIDRLLNKLPPPEKLVKPVTQFDPASSDPLVKDMMAAAKTRNFGRALSLSRRLCEKYPKSAAAHCIHGLFAFSLRRYPESSTAFRAALSAQPKMLFAHLGFATAEAAQNQYATALSSYQQVTRLDPKAEIGWLGASACADMLGRRQDSLAYAKQATAVAPKSSVAWLQLARAEKASGHDQAALKALNRSNQLRRSARPATYNAGAESRNSGQSTMERLQDKR